MFLYRCIELACCKSQRYALNGVKVGIVFVLQYPMKSLNIKFILVLINFFLVLNGYSEECSTPSMAPSESGIVLSGSRDSDGHNSKKISIVDSVVVDGLNMSTFDKIKGDPQLIADILGAKLIPHLLMKF